MTNKQEPIFVSYAHQGKGSQFISLCEDALFAANMEHSTWTDQEIELGDKWQEKIESALSAASAAVAADTKLQVTPERLLPGHPGGTSTVVFHTTREVLASGGADGAVRISHFARSEDVPTILRGIDADVLSLAWSEEGTELVVSYKHQRVKASADGNKEPGHGAVHVWSWDLEDIANIACRSVWRSLNPKEWAQWIQPVSTREYDPACSATRE